MSVEITVPLTGEVEAIETGKNGRRHIRGDVRPPGLAEIMAVAGRPAGKAEISAEVLSIDIDAGTCVLRVTGPESWESAVAAELSGKTADEQEALFDRVVRETVGEGKDAKSSVRLGEQRTGRFPRLTVPARLRETGGRETVP